MWQKKKEEEKTKEEEKKKEEKKKKKKNSSGNQPLCEESSHNKFVLMFTQTLETNSILIIIDYLLWRDNKMKKMQQEDPPLSTTSSSIVKDFCDSHIKINGITTDEILQFILDILFTCKFASFMWKETSPALLILIMDVLKPKFIDHVNSYYDTIDTWDEDRSYYGVKFLVDDFIEQNGLLKLELINLLAMGFKLNVRKEKRLACTVWPE